MIAQYDLGFVGTGGRTVAELVDLVHIPAARISALCDIDEARCNWAIEQVLERQPDAPGTSLVREQAPRTFTDVRDMLAAVELDAMYVSLPPFAHGDIDHAILDAGKAFFVEKPVAVNSTVGREIAAHVAEAGVVSSVGYQSRYSSAVQQARAALDDVPLGLSSRQCALAACRAGRGGGCRNVQGACSLSSTRTAWT